MAGVVFLLILLTSCAAQRPGMAGVWEIQEEERTYQATLDEKGNGPYTWKEGRIQTTEFVDRVWKGTWHQTGNDREGEFELLLSEDGQQAEGVWWYTRVGENKDIPAQAYGGDYLWLRRLPNSAEEK